MSTNLTLPNLTLPDLPLFDAHCHIIDPHFPLIENKGFLPEPFTVDDYRARVAGLDVIGGAVVSGSFQGTDQSYLLAALATLGSGWVGVTQLSPDTSDERIVELDRAGVRALRFNLARGSQDLESLTALALRAYEVAGWHAEFYVDAALLPALAPVFARLPLISVDHLGLTATGLPHLLDAVDRGVRVKATGFGRVQLDVPDALRRIHAVNPAALLFGTDLPGTRAPRAFEPSDIQVLADAIGGNVPAVLADNAAAWYRR